MVRRAFLVVSLCLLAVASSYAASVQFAARVDIPTHLQQLSGVAIADFNGDGFPDIAVTDFLTNRVAVYLNDRTGNFGNPVITTVPASNFNGFTAVVAGDINHDGKQDLIVAPYGSPENPLVLFGNGDGTFNPGQRLPLPNDGFLVAALADVNGDGHLDLVTGSFVTPYIELGDGTGNFTDVPLPQGVTPNSQYHGLTVGDFNGDGHLDFAATTNFVAEVDVWVGKGDGTFPRPDPTQV